MGEYSCMHAEARENAHAQACEETHAEACEDIRVAGAHGLGFRV